jgi:hypothetical protein
MRISRAKYNIAITPIRMAATRIPDWPEGRRGRITDVVGAPFFGSKLAFERALCNSRSNLAKSGIDRGCGL